MHITTAWHDGCSSLYHWQPFNHKEWKDRLIQLLDEHLIYFSRPQDFNDPWDCKPCFNTEVLDDPQERVQLANWICKGGFLEKEKFSNEEINRIKKNIEICAQYAKNFINDHAGWLASATAGKRIYCTGNNVDNILMWSHYANKHTGICLEFNFPEGIMRFAMKCQYFKTYPILKLHDQRDHLLTILSKADGWNYENEYRIIAQERCHAIQPCGLLTDNNFLKLSPGTLRSVIVGCRGDYQAVKDVVRRINPNVKVKHALQIANRYALTIKE